MQDVILKIPAWLNDPRYTPERSNVKIVYLITGNPGLISYYGKFLDLLAKGCAEDAIIAGASLAGFENVGQRETPANKIERELLYPETFSRKPIYDLQDQIDLTETRLEKLVENVRMQYKGVQNASFSVTLIGHSVGAYIALEVVKSRHMRSQVQTVPFRITATIFLTPTIHDISQSPSGKIATPVLSNIPLFPALVQLGASSLASTLPTAWLRSIVATVMGMSDAALATTVSFLQTPGAVKQALFMARCEMLEIGPNQWTDDIWGTVDHGEVSGGTENVKDKSVTDWRAPKHHFLFAKEDHWVADVTRESIVKSLQARAKIIVDSDGSLGLVHAWCLKQSEMVAELVEAWLREIASESEKRSLQ